MFTPESVKIVNQIGDLNHFAKSLLEQRNQVKKNDVLKDAYTLAISSTLEAIGRLTDKLAVEKELPTDSNQ